MKDIPIVINNYNRHKMLKSLIWQLRNLGYNNITVLDNRSTYLPLRDYYRHLVDSGRAKVWVLDKNYGHKSLWASGLINQFKDYEYIVYTDPDLELNPNTPKNFIDNLIKVSKEYKFDKVGLSIKIDDLPNNFMGNKIRQTEAIYWVRKLYHRTLELYQGMIDTTFCIIKPENPFQYPAIRIAGDYTCRHLPWYIDYTNLDKEEQYLIDNNDPNISTYIQHYKEWKEKLH